MVDNIGSKTDSMSQTQGPSNATAGSSSSQGLLREQDWLLPIANVGRIMKQTLPPNAKISKEAKETMQECVSEFISFVTGEASDKCHKEKRKTVNGDDICWALSTLGFDDYVEPMKAYLRRYREVEGEKSSSANPNRANDGGGGGGGVDELRLFGDDENALRSLGTSSTLMFDASDRNNRSNLRQF